MDPGGTYGDEEIRANGRKDCTILRCHHLLDEITFLKAIPYLPCLSFDDFVEACTVEIFMAGSHFLFAPFFGVALKNNMAVLEDLVLKRLF